MVPWKTFVTKSRSSPGLQIELLQQRTCRDSAIESTFWREHISQSTVHRATTDAATSLSFTSTRVHALAATTQQVLEKWNATREILPTSLLA